MRQNCLGYALGITGNITSEIYGRTFELENPNPVECFLEKLDELGYIATKVSSNASPLEANQLIIAFWGFFPYVDKSMGFTSYVYDFHVARQEHDGGWTHKWGWDCNPEPTTIGFLIEEYGSVPYFFSIRKKAP